MPDLVSLIAAMRALKAVVVGDAVLDGYLRGGAERVCREAPVPVVRVDSVEEVPGGAANVAANVAALGAGVRLVSAVGTDRDGDRLAQVACAAGVEIGGLVRDSARRTPAKRRIVADDQIVARFDTGDTGPISPAAERGLLENVERVVGDAGVLIVSDYDCGVMTSAVIERLAMLQEAEPRVVVVDAKSVRRYGSVQPTAVKPNYDEVHPLLCLDASAHEDRQAARSRADVVLSACEQLPRLTGAHIVAVTLDGEGAVVCERGRPPYRTYARHAASQRACGAGDAFTAALALALAAGADTPAAAELASAAASVTLRRDGTVPCHAAELYEHVLGGSARLRPLAALAELVAAQQRKGLRVVFTNGCFDILHRGHVEFLNRAKEFGDVLIVGLNSDDSIRRLKGADRPVNRLEDRAQVVGALSCVDHLVAFDGETAADLLEGLRPTVYVKGGDYTPYMLPERATVERIGAEIRIVPYLEDRSTTSIIERIRGSSGPGAQAAAGVQ
jgi:D-beta-D-heptose 7-phosphate kinase/D-beta-D-heptose 1-phosphate adenosyltransferase